MQDLHEEITAQILAAIEGGREGWEALWDNSLRLGLPYNHSTGKNYTGINILSLWNVAMRKGYEINAWMTYKQAKEQGGQVRKGEKSALGMFYKPIEDKSEDTDNEEEKGGRRRMMAKAFYLFNVAQIDGLEGLPEPKAPNFSPIADAEAIITASGAEIRHGGTRAFFSPAMDFVQMPSLDRFHSAENYYATILHELTHWTGHKSRLAREYGKRFGDRAYAFEELIAELGTAFLCARLGLVGATLEGHADYIADWLKILKNDKRAVMTAASQAERAAEYLAQMLEAGSNQKAG
ncbi:DUF1738 domain-containing protein [Acidithiobacillus thiooxidans]|uniref:ArdC family protein n=1 Tax=Acidithiobacillus thiooxidans TaxID=930 RepID=UPI001C06CC94|nr:zincin-like metallopeptidase domain-containing protein [Acidithiobacillus thiooxidans]MBU2836362.1 DUF1738 domain-containing protein [Acidithiobacillus thiooxidans]